MLSPPLWLGWFHISFFYCLMTGNSQGSNCVRWQRQGQSSQRFFFGYWDHATKYNCSHFFNTIQKTSIHGSPQFPFLLYLNYHDFSYITIVEWFSPLSSCFWIQSNPYWTGSHITNIPVCPIVWFQGEGGGMHSCLLQVY